MVLRKGLVLYRRIIDQLRGVNARFKTRKWNITWDGLASVHVPFVRLEMIVVNTPVLTELNRYAIARDQSGRAERLKDLVLWIVRLK